MGISSSGRITQSAVGTTSTISAEISGAAGIPTYRAAAAAANDVSISEVIRWISEKQIRNHLQKATATLPQTGDQTLFTVSGGNVLVTSLVGEVTTVIETQANNTLIKHNPTGTGADVDLCAALDITADAVGTLYSITGAVADALKSATLWIVLPADNIQTPGIVLAPGLIELECAASNTGSVQWDIEFILLESGASVA